MRSDDGSSNGRMGVPKKGILEKQTEEPTVERTETVALTEELTVEHTVRRPSTVKLTVKEHQNIPVTEK